MLTYLQSDPQGQIPIESHLQLKCFHARKYSSNSCLQNVDCFLGGHNVLSHLHLGLHIGISELGQHWFR